MGIFLIIPVLYVNHFGKVFSDATNPHRKSLFKTGTQLITVKLENVVPMLSSFRPLFSYLSVAIPVLSDFRDQCSAF